MDIQKLDELEKQIKPLIEPFIGYKINYVEFASDKYCDLEDKCYCCEYALAFYDDVDVCCACGFAGNEHLCPIIQDKLNIKVEGYDKIKKQIKNILESEIGE